MTKYYIANTDRMEVREQGVIVSISGEIFQ